MPHLQLNNNNHRIPDPHINDVLHDVGIDEMDEEFFYNIQISSSNLII